MAKKYGTNATKFLVTSPPEKMEIQEVGGRMRSMHDVYEADAVADGDFIYMGGVIPEGAVIEPISRIDHDALGTATDIAVYLRLVSDDATDTALITDQDTSSSGDILFTDIAKFPYTVTADSYMVLEVENAAITGTIKSNIYFTPRA